MYIPPKRRRRILTAHHLRQQGLSLRKIAKRLGVSHSTIRADLKLAETHWSEVAAPAADDLLLNQLHLLRCFLPALLVEDLTETYAHFSVAEYTKLYKIRATEIATFLRETRRTVEQVHRRAAQREAQPDLFDEIAEELVEDLPTPSKTIHPEPPISQPEQEIVESKPSENVQTFHSDDAGGPPVQPLAESVLDVPTPSKTVHPEPPISQPEQEIIESNPPEKVQTVHSHDPDPGEIPDHILENIPDDVLAEARAFIAALDAEPALAFADAAGGG